MVNGTGKSTTLAALLGFASAQSGSIAVCGIDPAADPDAARQRIAYLQEKAAIAVALLRRVPVLLLAAFDPGVDASRTRTELQPSDPSMGFADGLLVA